MSSTTETEQPTPQTEGGTSTAEQTKAPASNVDEGTKPEAAPTEKQPKKSLVSQRAAEAKTAEKASKGKAAKPEDSDAGNEADAEQTEDEAEATDGDSEQTDDGDGEPEGAPEKYEFKAPEGQEFDAPTLAAFEDAARELDLTNDQAQKILDRVAPVMAQRQQEAIEAQQDRWLEELTNDTDLGGEKLDETMRLAAKGHAILPERTRQLLDGPLGDHPAIVAGLREIGLRISPDRQAGKGAEPARNTREPTPDELLAAQYPNDVA